METLLAGDANCPAGGVRFTLGSTVAYACSGLPGSTGPQGPEGPAGAPGPSLQYGDGSAGARVVSQNETLNDGNLQFTDFTVNAGVTLTVDSGTTIRCSGSFTNNGTIVVLPSAPSGYFLPNISPNEGVIIPPNPGLTTRFAIVGDPRYFVPRGGSGLTETQARQLVHARIVAGGGGASGREGELLSGGGFIVVRAQGLLSSSATIEARGIAGVSGNPDPNSVGGTGGGGGGGIVVLASATQINHLGTIDASGGAGGDASKVIDCAGGGGGGGIAHLIAPNVQSTGTLNVSGGAPGDTGSFCSNLNRRTGAGGGSGGAGGNGGYLVQSSPSPIMIAPEPGAPGHAIVTVADPGGLF